MRRKPGDAVEASWPKLVLKKWLNIRTRSFDYRADDGQENEDQNYPDQDDDEQEVCGCEEGTAETRAGNHDDGASYRLRRTNSETLRAQYIKTKELRIWVGTWNAGGKVPSDDQDMEEWLDLEEPADIYAIGIQEIVPLNAGNVLGAEDSRPVAKWEHLIRETLNRINLRKPKYKCYSDPPSPSRFEPAEDVALGVDEFISETESDTTTADDDDNNKPLFSYNDQNPTIPVNINDSTSYSNDTSDTMRLHSLDHQRSFAKRLQRLNHFSLEDHGVSSDALLQEKLLGRAFSTSEKIVMAWPEQPLDLSANRTINTLSSVKSFRAKKSFKLADSNKYESLLEIHNFAPELELSIAKCRRKKVEYVRIVSKQMVGIFLSIWVRRSLWKHIQNVKVSTVGVGVMGYIGNKGSISVSMSIYQTLFCFVCSHLSSGEENGDELRRNADVQEIHRRTQFSSVEYTGLSRRIHDHERIFWFGDLNYRIDLPYDKTHALISRKEWSILIENDQLKRELKKGRTFDGWSEGVISFPPTYKYEFNSTNYVRDDEKGGRRNPAWCDRILSFGECIRLLKYKRAEQKLSDHRPVMATYIAEVEIFCHKKLQRALTLTDAELEHGDIISGFISNISSNKTKPSRGLEY